MQSITSPTFRGSQWSGEEFEQARSKGLGNDDLAQVAQAATAGQVATLLIEADRQIAGRFDAATSRVEVADLSHPQVDDLLDDLGDLVEKMGGNDDMRCVMEARLEGRQPIAVTHQAATLDEAVDGAADKLTKLIESTLGRLRDHRESQH